MDSQTAKAWRHSNVILAIWITVNRTLKERIASTVRSHIPVTSEENQTQSNHNAHKENKMAKKKKTEEESDQQLPAKVEEMPLAQEGTGFGGLEGLEGATMASFKIPRRVIAQPQSTWTEEKGVQSGTLVSTLDDGDFKEEIDGILLRAHPGRIYFESPTDDRPACGSDNGLVPASRFQDPPSDKCVTRHIKGEDSVCEFSAWNTGKDGKPKPPPCQASWNLLILDRDDGVPFWISVKGTSFQSAKSLFSSINKEAIEAKSTKLCCCSFTLDLVRREKPKPYYLTRFSNFKQLEEEEAGAALEMFARFSGLRNIVEEEPKEKIDGDPDDEFEDEPVEGAF